MDNRLYNVKPPKCCEPDKKPSKCCELYEIVDDVVKKNIQGKQNKLIAGQNITIKDDIISATGGGFTQQQADWAQTDASADDFIKHKPNIYTKTETDALLAGKQNVIDDLATIRSGAQAGATAVQPSDIAQVATSGSYNDLSDKPTIPTVPTNVSAFNNDAGYLTEHQSLTNYVQKSQTAGLLKNDGTVDTSQYLTQHQDISGKADKSEMSVVPGTGANADKTTITLKQGTSATVLTAHQDVADKEDKIPIVQVASGTTAITAAVNTYYEVAGEVGALAITLPTPTDLTNVSMVVIHLTAGTTPNVVIGSTETIDYSSAYDISASKEYEINCLFNGDKWVVADMEVV